MFTGLRAVHLDSDPNKEPSGAVGPVCIYPATSPEAIRRHAGNADLPVSEIIQVADTVYVRPDPAPRRRL